MDKVNKFLLMVIAMAAIMITAVGIDRGMEYYNAQKWEKERGARYEQARAQVAEMQLTISELSGDQEAIEAFIEENRKYFEEAAAASESESALPEEEQMSVSDNAQMSVSDNMQMSVSDNTQISASENRIYDISGNELSEPADVQDVSANELMDVSGNIQGDVSGNRGADISGNELENVTVSGNTLLEKRKIRGSYMETQMQNEADRIVIAGSSYDFSHISIACLGDSITQASNLESMEDYQQYAYPARLKEILGAESVTNLGIGGSSIGRYWNQAYVDRYREIPQDTDLIIVMGGTNDGFCLTQEELGTLEERRAGTFIGDLDELMQGLKENYPDATLVFATPLPNILHDVLRKERQDLLPQTTLVNVMKQLAEEYEIPVIDLYNSNILDTHDAAVIYNYMPDGVHCNPDGYMILAEHFAAELIKLYEKQRVGE